MIEIAKIDCTNYIYLTCESGHPRLHSFTHCIYLVNIVLSMPDTGLLPGGLGSEEENGRKRNKKTTELISEGVKFKP